MSIRQRLGLLFVIIWSAQMHDSKSIAGTVISGALMLVGAFMLMPDEK